MIAQGSPEWHALRCGKVTASRVADIVRKTKSGVSASRQRYLGELVAERLTGVPHQGFKSSDMEWGNATEESARQFYAFLRDVKLEAVAFVDHPNIAMSGASPDHLVDDDGLIEVKCPATHTHLDALLGTTIDPDYFKQMQWQMACTGRDWCDFISFDPRMPEEMRMVVQRVPRDELQIGALEREVELFIAEVDDTLKQLRLQYAEAA
jgi:putative phage-type endonuclease